MLVRNHGWQRPLHSLQIVGMAVYCFLVMAFYAFLGLLLGNRVAEITVTTIYSFVVVSVMFLFIRCTAIDPTDKTRFRKRRKAKSDGVVKLNYGFLLNQVIVRFFKRVERKILRTFIRRKYFDQWKTAQQIEPLLPFPLIIKEDTVTFDSKEDDISFCAICDFEVKKRSKHCRTCNRCVEGFDHHCRWLNNCIGKKNYTTFILLMASVLLMLIIQGGTAIAIFIRCFADKKGVEEELKTRLYVEFPRALLATISVLLFLLSVYSSAAMGQLFFFHLVLIRKGIRTYDYILAIKEENKSMEQLYYSDTSSDESSDFDTPEKPTFISRFSCRGQKPNQSPTRLSIKIDGDSASDNKPENKLYVSIDPWKLIKLSRDKALLAAEKARERLKNQKPENDQLKPLPLEIKCGPLLMNPESEVGGNRLPGSPGKFSSPRRRFSGSSAIMPSPKHKYKSNFDLKLTEVSKELENYISRQALCSVIKKDFSEST